MQNNTQKINLGGFPPIYIITEDVKKIREYSHNIKQKKMDVKNIINVVNILKK